MSASSPKADFERRGRDARFVPKADVIAIKRAYLTRYYALPHDVS
jgi:hypothetical protein